MKQATIRNLHRDLGYFYIGLIISFAFSGILMNHREMWHPEKYTIETQSIDVKLPEENQINDEYAENFAKELGIKDKFRRQMVKKGSFKISFEKHDVEIDMKTGKGEIVSFNKTPIISQAMKLHKNTSNWWIYYSDIFGISLIIIAVTGALMIKVGNKTFSKRGWKLAAAGLLVPLLILLFV
ncbi:PepSY-associated TM helix domain-containing protein [Flavobacterium capsici]|uniref:PepSY-associated TM helix domain-containing protein n=1 Tax=Flavobacterium capsici TaxID=3075618 RepID=A0AA96J663_9FLAO|nr:MULTISPECIES: PepSY-associated TM helix domain-containing protein [unclassified Flavobacterium]WNM18372.1 PepSY-associated TM helix domain-containing protein [Flavobacterium sp. PMR2A8]WNM22423.1 PepSY-associated TM helix domain-containing protein [Flavobacterium sp. PMTSA4]